MRPISVFTPSTTVSETACIPQSHKPPPPVIPQEIAEESQPPSYIAANCWPLSCTHNHPPPRPRIRGLGGARRRPTPALVVGAQAVLCVAGLPNPVQYKEGKKKVKIKKVYCIMCRAVHHRSCTLHPSKFNSHSCLPFLPDATMPSMMAIEPDQKNDSSSTVSPISMYQHHYHLNCGARPGDIEPSIHQRRHAHMASDPPIERGEGGPADYCTCLSPYPRISLRFSILELSFQSFSQSNPISLRGTLMIGPQEDPFTTDRFPSRSGVSLQPADCHTS